LVGDDPYDLDDRFYGNPDVKGPRSNHGTSVAGVIAAIRDNNIGIDGIATDVKIMVLRSTPGGDERDKDVALSIIYAVDNGADIINMSFGKDFSPQKQFVDYAVKYAEERGVLLVHGSGNSGVNIDLEESFPSDRFLDGGTPTNWLSVGATSMKLDMEIAAVFSNYGKMNVDVLAPGVNIISTDSSNTYSMNSGTSLSSPIAAGIAALILSHYPELTPAQLIEVITEGAYTFSKPKKVFIPSLKDEKRKKYRFSELSESGGIINAYGALLKAEEKSKQ
jgi:subtilisin family serine protease